jgi:hypothetical protein
MRGKDEGGQVFAERARQAIVAGLESRREEIERAFWKRIESDPNVREILDVEYMEGLRASVSKALEYGVSGIESNRGRAPQVPAVLLTQARLAARNSVALSVVQRRYMDCYHLFAAFLSEEAEKQGTAGVDLLKNLQATMKTLFDKLIDTVEEEYAQEHAQPSSPERQRVELVKEHLAGKAVARSELGYEFNYFHVALIARGASAASAIKDLASELDCLPSSYTLARAQYGRGWASARGRTWTSCSAWSGHDGQRRHRSGSVRWERETRGGGVLTGRRAARSGLPLGRREGYSATATILCSSRSHKTRPL